MEIQCECGKFRANLKAFPKNTPGRLVCYCDDCQSYMHHIQRSDLLDANGGTEIIPAYPADIEILSGKEHLKCMRLAPHGMFRFSTTCCNTPIANTQPNQAWAGILRRVYTVKDPHKLDQILGPVRARVMGKFAKGTPPEGTAKKFNFRGFKLVMPFILKGIIRKKTKPSPFFAEDGLTAIATPHIMSKEERAAAKKFAGVI